MNKKEQEKHDIALLVEQDLYRMIKTNIEQILRANDEPKMEEEIKKEVEEELIEAYMMTYIKSETMTEEEIKEHIKFVLNRTEINRAKLKREQEVDER